MKNTYLRLCENKIEIWTKGSGSMEVPSYIACATDICMLWDALLAHGLALQPVPLDFRLLDMTTCAEYVGN